MQGLRVHMHNEVIVGIATGYLEVWNLSPDYEDLYQSVRLRGKEIDTPHCIRRAVVDIYCANQAIKVPRFSLSDGM